MGESVTEKKAREQFEEATADHTMRVLHDDDVYRHLLFRAEDSIFYYYALTTWPGHLAINGDLDSGYVFARAHDMIGFFASGPDINPHYWSEKITNHDARAGTREYSEAVMRERVAEELREMAESEEVEAAVIEAAWTKQTRMLDFSTEEVAREAIQNFTYVGRRFPDSWEWDLRDWKTSFLLSCHAIRTGVQTYLKARVTT